MPMEYIVHSLRIAVIIAMNDVNVVEEILLQLVHLEKDRFVASYHQNVEKVRQKAWHDRHIKNKQFHIEDLVLLYDSKFLKHPSKLRTHWLGSYIVSQITEGRAMQLKKLDGTPFKGLVNGSRLNPYHDSRNIVN